MSTEKRVQHSSRVKGTGLERSLMSLLEVALYEPEIPPNTGNIIRLCANTGCRLHLIGPLGFSLTDKNLKRAGLDYHEYVGIKHYENFEAFLTAMENRRIFACTTKASQWHTDITYNEGDIFLFGPETRGLPVSILKSLSEDFQLRIPMLPQSRSLNLSNAVAVIVYEGWRQLEFKNGK